MAEPEKNIKCSTRIITTDSEFDSIEQGWNELFQTADATIYQSFEWQRTWWKYFNKPNYKLHIILFQVNNELIGIGPIFEEYLRLFGSKIVTRIQFIGYGLSDYVDFIIKPGYEKIVLDKFAVDLLTNRKEWNLVDIEGVNENSSLVKLLPEILHKLGIRNYKYQGNVCPHVKLPTPSDNPNQEVGPTASQNFKRKFKKLENNFDTKIELIQHETDDIRAAVDAFVKVHSARWKSLGYPSAFDDELHREFHVEFSQRFAKRGWLKLFLMKVDGETVAVSYNFNFRKRIYMYQSNAYGTEEVMRCSPGLLIRGIAMADGIKTGMEVFDYLRGDESYKFLGWNVVASKNYLIRINSPSGKKILGYALFLIYDLVGKVKSRLVREYYEYRRFTITKKPTASGKMKYIWKNISGLVRLGFNFIVRHAPISAIRKLERINQDNSESTIQE